MNLKEFGQKFLNVLKGTDAVMTQAAGFGGIIASVIPGKAGAVAQTAMVDLGQVENIVKLTEGFGELAGMSDDDKLTAASQLTGQLVINAENLAGHEVADPALQTLGIQQVTEGVRNILLSRKVVTPVTVAAAKASA